MALLAPLSPRVRAQGAAPPDTLAVTGGADGLRFRSSSGRFDVRVGALGQTDVRVFLEEAVPAADQFLVRRARVVLSGTAGRLSFRLIPDFGQGRVEVEEAWAEWRVLDGLGLRAGQQKVPVGLEWLRSSSDLAFVERALPAAVTPRSEPGLMLRGEALDRRLEAAVGVFDGGPDGQLVTGDAGDSKDAVARVFGRPYVGTHAELGVGVAGTIGREDDGAVALPSYRTAAGFTFARYRDTGDDSTSAFADGVRWRLAPQATLLVGPVQAYAEYLVSSQRVVLGAAADDVHVSAWQVAAVAVLTGERATLGRLRPARPVDEGGSGAIEVGARYHALDVERDAFPVFFDPTASLRAARAVTFGVTWSLTGNVRVMANVERTSFRAAPGGTQPPAEVVAFGRLQMAF